ncbi:ribosome-binding factor A [Deinococcus yavapaiensis KR-236]|uniref:Ribosome-binding factor A n=2 Tax=Deinococcus TaxID=1298 RepID=A0A318S5L8_9DEIO|nr:ribosome-binding factor A [Deinococcus yavapaiensis KR-236]
MRALSGAIAELRDPRVPLIVTVERVSVTSDYGLARVYVSALGDMSGLMEALEQARGRLQREVARTVKLRRTPILEFYDASERLS